MNELNANTNNNTSNNTNINTNANTNDNQTNNIEEVESDDDDEFEDALTIENNVNNNGEGENLNGDHIESPVNNNVNSTNSINSIEENNNNSVESNINNNLNTNNNSHINTNAASTSNTNNRNNFNFINNMNFLNDPGIEVTVQTIDLPIPQNLERDHPYPHVPSKSPEFKPFKVPENYASYNNPEGKELQTCSICLEEMNQKKHALTRLVCGHEFHMSCVGSWFNSISKIII